MPRVSLKHEDAMMGVGIQEGYFEITKSVCAVHQFPPNSKTGVQSDPFTAVRWTCNKLNEDWSSPDEPESAPIIIRLGKLDSIRPGSLKNPDNLDEEPKDMGQETDTEGNSVFGEPGAKASGNWGAMEESLRKRNFRPDIVERLYMPDYVGMKFHVKTVPAGTYKDKSGETKEATNLVCDQIHTYPYDVKKGKGGKAGSAKSTAAKSESADEADATVRVLLADPSDIFKKAVPSGKPVKRSMFQVQFQLELARKKIDKALHQPMLTILKNDEQLTEIANEVGFGVDLEEQTVVFP